MSQETKAYLDGLFGPWLDEAVGKLRTEILETRWEEYLELVKMVEAHPSNRTGADKTWVEEVLEANRRHYRHATRVH
jgi:hypothetical protein